MPRSLKFYIAGVVALSAVALVAATLVFPIDPRIALGISDPRVRTATCQHSFRLLPGVAFWILLTLVTSALPVKLPLGSHQAVSMAPVVAVMRLAVRLRQDGLRRSARPKFEKYAVECRGTGL